MAWDFKELKKQKKPEFHRNYSKYYPVKSLNEIGFSRKVCTKCGRGFWSAVDRDYCDEPACSGGYRFIGEKLTRKRFGYREAWDEYVKVFKKWGYVPLKRYPVVCRWYDELYFVNAGINDFQPYVVSGSVAPPADAVLEPQFCMRFSDIDSVGITGRHYTGFIMVGQHTFRTPEKPNVYFKEEGIKQMHEFLTKGLGIKAAEIFYHEDVWAGGGNFGPSMEFFARGLELGNQVYMQYEVLPDGSSRELSTKVIDMGAGLERWSWFSQGTAMSYDTVFPKVMDYLYKKTGLKDKKIWTEFARYSGLLDIDEIDDVGSVWNDVAKELGVNLGELKEEVYQRRSLYAIADHTRTLLVAIHDGALPSNVGGGYNLRNLLRRCWDLMDEFNFDIELEKVFEGHIKEFGSWYTELKEIGSLWDILAVEGTRYEKNKENWPRIIQNEERKIRRMIKSPMIKPSMQKKHVSQVFSPERLVELYLSHGISPNFIEKQVSGFKIPDDFYGLVEEHREKSKVIKEEKELMIPKNLPETKSLYYEKEGETFEATVLGVFDDYVVLDQTLFYPEGGGQESDLGTIDGVTVKDVQKSGNVVVHRVEDISRFKKGQKVKGNIDYVRRTQLAQHHTATHIVNAAARKVLGPHVWQAGAHKSVEASRLDITHYRAVTEGELRKIEDEANKIVDKKIPVNVHIMKRNEAEEKYGFRLYQGGAVPGLELRIVDVAGVDTEACGGTHLANTGDTGTISMVRSKRIQDGVVRLEFKAGKAAKREVSSKKELHDEIISTLIKGGFEIKDTAFNDSKLNEATNIFNVQVSHLPMTISRFLSESDYLASPLKEADDVADACRKLFDLRKYKKKSVKSVAKVVGPGLEKEIEKSFKKNSKVKKLTKGHTIPTLMELASDATKTMGRVLVWINVVGEKANVVVSSSNPKVNAEKLAIELSKKLGGGASGDKEFAIGGGRSENAEKVLEEFKI